MPQQIFYIALSAVAFGLAALFVSPKTLAILALAGAFGGLLEFFLSQRAMRKVAGEWGSEIKWGHTGLRSQISNMAVAILLSLVVGLGAIPELASGRLFFFSILIAIFFIFLVVCVELAVAVFLGNIFLSATKTEA